jgi:elongator complex protein 3
MKTAEYENQYNFSDEEKKAIDEILTIEELKDIEKSKRVVVRKYKLNRYPSNSQIIKRAKDLSKANEFEFDSHPWIKTLNKKPTRSISGVSIVAIMLPPNLGVSKGFVGSCPFHCTYCPSAENAPKSYIGKEPSTLRAIGHNYDPYAITKGRIEQLRLIGHRANKIQLVLQGGTFLAMPEDEQDNVLKAIFDAITETRSESIYEAMTYMESSNTRCIGLTYETRPDFCKISHVDRMLNRLGTMVEIGVQTLSNDVLKIVKRGHKVNDVYEANKIARDAGLKITFHMMPNLYSTPEIDFDFFDELFTNEDLRPDGLKLYPLLVMPGTELYNEWKSGNFKPYSDDELIETLAKIKNKIPEYTRIHRIQRDIPVKYVKGGLLLGNLRNIVKEYMLDHGMSCSCIRCREIGHNQNLKGYIAPEDSQLKLDILKYDCADGIEWFLSIVDPQTKVLFGFLRMRFPSPDAHRTEITKKSAIIRELHVYGKELEIKSSPLGIHTQHKGLGRKLMAKAEEIALENGYEELLVISGIGVREYYKNLGYQQKGPYVSRKLI